MGAPDLLHALQGQGLRVWMEGNRLLVAPKARLTDETRTLIREHKSELLAVLVNPLPDPAAEAELRRLVNVVADFHRFSPKDRREALEVALRDQANALDCFRLLANECGTAPALAGVEARRQRLQSMLDAHPEARYALLTDSGSNPEAIIVAVAIRGQATCELFIPREKFDGTLLLDLIEKHGGTVH